MTASVSMQTGGGCGEQQRSWEKCVSRQSSRKTSKCAQFESELRKCSAATRTDFCIDETVSLASCTSSRSGSGSADLCATEFVNFRECRRPAGRQLVQVNAGGFAVVEAAKTLYLDQGAQVLLTGRPAGGSLSAAADEYARSLGLANGPAELRF